MVKPAWKEGKLYLSDALWLESVPEEVWNYTLGGYPVLSKWLGYRKDTVLELEDAQWLSEVVQRIAALLSMGTELDAHYSFVASASSDSKAQQEVVS